MVDNLVILYKSTETVFTTLGIGVLIDAMKCEVVEEINGEFTLIMEYPINGRFYDEIQLRSIIKARPSVYGEEQLFRINSISRPIDGTVTVEAQHISYDLSWSIMPVFSSTNISGALHNIRNMASDIGDFTFVSHIVDEFIPIGIKKPTSVRSLIGGQEGSILSTYGGEVEFNNFSVKFTHLRGEDNGVKIVYGKNMTELDFEENCSEMFNKIYPYWYSEQDGYVEIPEKFLTINPDYNFNKTSIVDFTSMIKEKPTPEELKNFAEDYAETNESFGAPTISMSVSFETLSQFKEYEHLMVLENVSLGDIVSIEYQKLNVNAKARCIKTTYDVLGGKYISLELGDYKPRLSDTIVDNQNSMIDKINQVMENVPQMSAIEEAIDNATQLITGGLGGYVIIRDSSGGDKPDEILIMNTDNVNTATNVWRFNKNGLGFSDNGYNGPFELAMTSDGSINASMITSGILVANGTFTGSIEANSGNIGGFQIDSSSIYSTNCRVGMSTNDDRAFWAGCNGFDEINLSRFLVKANGDVSGAYASFQDFYVEGHSIIERGDDYVIFYEGTKIVYFDIDVTPSPNELMCIPIAFPERLKFSHKPAIICTPITSDPWTQVKGCACRDRTALGTNLYFYRTDDTPTTVSILAIGKWDR